MGGDRPVVAVDCDVGVNEVHPAGLQVVQNVVLREGRLQFVESLSLERSDQKSEECYLDRRWSSIRMMFGDVC